MFSETDALADEALRDVSYLTRSRNRVQILGAVAGEPLTPRELAKLTGTSRSTLQRILSELDDRGWIRRTQEGSYVATAIGSHVVNELIPFVESIETIRELGEAVAALPTDVRSIGKQHFDDATIHQPQPNDPTAPGAFFARTMRETSKLRCVVDIAAPLALGNAMRDGVVEGSLQSEHILSDRLFRYICQDSDRAQIWRELTQAGADVYWHEGEILCNVFILDETVLLGETPPEGEGCVLLETDNEDVREWAHEMIDDSKAKADRLTGRAFTDDGVSPA